MLNCKIVKQTKNRLPRPQEEKEKDTGGKVKLQETTKGRVESLLVEREITITKSLGLRWQGLVGFWMSAPDLLNNLNKTVFLLASLLYNEGMRPPKF